MKRGLYPIIHILLAVFILACGGIVYTLPPTPAAVEYVETTIDARPPVPTVKTQPHMVVCGTDEVEGGLRIRVGAGTEYATAQDEPLLEGAEVVIIGGAVASDMGFWYQIEMGYVNSKFLCDK